MGIESDRLVYDYLSRVGDLAQQRQLPASDRMKLVSGLRNEIDRRRATHGEESEAAVRGILGSLGSPDEVVDRAGPSDGRSVPEPRTGTGRTRGLRRTRGTGPDASGNPRVAPGASASAGEPGRGARGSGAAAPGAAGREGARPGAAGPGAAGPGAAGPGGSGSRAARPSGSGSRAARPSGSGPAIPAQGDRGRPDGAGSGGAAADRAADWWRTDTEDPSDEDGFFGFVGGIERPDLFTPPAPEEDEDDAAEEPAPGKARRLARVLRRRKTGAPAVEEAPEEEAAPARARLANPFVLLAALLLLGGAVFGSLVALAAGWLLAYASRRLTPGEARTAVLVIPGLAAATGIVWLWGRVQGRWGEAVAPGGEAMGAAVSETWPWVLRGAAIASAAFLVWRARRN
ncbi:hypothetical protein ABTX77_20765 [Streptomyces sp. NPDC097704]|uniref:hypothetical protein n=1 Tax=Streptomyces sp. NPDC097704 TaxID=3157101 RepID=UPI00332C3CF3